MTVVPVDSSRTILEKEVTDAQPWAGRHSWELLLSPGALLLDVHLVHPVDQQPLLLRGEFSSYRAQPPLWVFLEPGTLTSTLDAWPSGGPVGNLSSIFIRHGGGAVICAHFNRGAYTSEGGPHAWGALSQWTQVRDGIHAERVGEMLAAIAVHLRHSPGRMA